MKNFNRFSQLSNKQAFLESVERRLLEFSENRFFEKLRLKNMTINEYHNILFSLFFQVKSSAATFALAAVNCPARHQSIQDYLFKHADEEKDHWRWILDDLKNTGYTGESPLSFFPPAETVSYVSFNYFIATKCPAARLGIAYVLETGGARFGKEFGTLLCQNLKLTPAQAKFFFGHGDTDVGHSAEILSLLDKSDVTAEEWGWFAYSADVAGKLLNAIYSSAVEP
jgi:hypothetical protein